MIDPNILFGRLGNRLFQMAYIYAQMKEGNIKDIYVQNSAYFEKYEQEIKQWFGENNKSLPYVSIHVRRGDYCNNPFYVDLSQTDYYEKAMEFFPNKSFMVFSDDIAFCKDYFKGDKFFFSEHKTELEDLNLQSMCEHNIIANSSFSLWGAILNNNLNKKIIAPTEKKYYSDSVVRTQYPNYFTQIDFQ